jgi:hypothetical protein
MGLQKTLETIFNLEKHACMVLVFSCMNKKVVASWHGRDPFWKNLETQVGESNIGMNLLENLRNPNIVNGGSYNQPHVATLKVVVHVPIKKVWYVCGVSNHYTWMMGCIPPSFKERKGGGFLGLQVTTLKAHNSNENLLRVTFPPPWEVGRRIGQPRSC